MIGRRSIVGLSLFSALFLCAFAAPSALGAKGTTTFTCVKTEKEAQFSDAHCTKGGTGEGYKHVAIVAGEKTSFSITNKSTQGETTEATPAIIRFHIGPMDGAITCPTVSGEGTLTNNAAPPMNVSGSASVTFSECTVSPKVTFPECQVENGTVTSIATLSTPTEAMSVNFAGEGGQFAKFTLIKCKGAGENGIYQISGAYNAIPNGTTWETTTASSIGLKSGGGQAGLESKTTVTMSPTEPGISLTTTES